MATKNTDTSTDTIDVTEVLATPVVEAKVDTPAAVPAFDENAVAIKKLEDLVNALGKQSQFADFIAILKAAK